MLYITFTYVFTQQGTRVFVHFLERNNFFTFFFFFFWEVGAISSLDGV